MFKLIKNIDHAYIEAGEFISESMPGFSASSKVIYPSIPRNFPSLIDWFTNLNYRGEESLNSHICDKNIAKCLIYPKTNKLRWINWYIVKNVEDIPNVISHSILFNKTTEIIKTVGFEKTALKLEQGEPFLLGAKSLYTGKVKHSKVHISIVNMTLARRLVYYKKDVEKIQDWPDLILHESHREQAHKEMYIYEV